MSSFSGARVISNATVLAARQWAWSERCVGRRDGGLGSNLLLLLLLLLRLKLYAWGRDEGLCRNIAQGRGSCSKWGFK